MKLKTLQLNNFMCYESATIDFPDSKVVNIYGVDLDRGTSNGIGKSAIKEAILFALYGKTKVNLAELVRKGTKGCKVVLTFETNNKEVTLIRSYKKTSTFVIKVNGKEIDLNKIANKRKYIEDLVEMDYDACVNFCIFDAIRFEDLSSLSSKEIKRLLQLLFNYEKFTQTYDHLKDLLRDSNNLLQKLQSRISHYYSDKKWNVLVDGKERLEGEGVAISNKIQVLHNLKYELGQQISSNNTIVDRNTKKINWLINKANCPTCNTPLTHKAAILNKYQQEINECNKKQQTLNNRVSRIDYYIQQHTVAVNNLFDRQQHIAFLLTKLDMAKQNTANVQELEKEHNRNKLATETMKKFESFVMEHYMHYLEQVVNEYLHKLTDITCTISFLKQGSLITRSIDKLYMKLQRGQEEFTYMSLSSGERMLVAYAFKLAINTLNFKDTFLFIDEGFNRLDKHNRQKLLQMLQESPFNQIFLVSHDDAFPDVPVIYIEKKDDISTVKGI